MKEAARSAAFDVIVVDDLSRLGRDAGESINVFKEFERLGIRLVTVADGIDTSRSSGKIPLYFKGIMTEMFLDDLKAKVKRGMAGQISRGYSTGGRVYGYKYVPEYDSSGAKDKFGRPIRHGVRIEINPAEAGVIKEIYRLALEGFGQRYIANKLNERGTASPQASNKKRSGKWTKSTVHTILNQQKYTGDWTWNKSHMVKMPDRKYRVRVENPKSEWIVNIVPELQIISNESWGLLRHQADNNGTKRLQVAKNKSSYLLSGLMKCGKCGRSMIVNNSGKYSAYMCGGYKNGGKALCNNSYRMNRAKVETVVIDEILGIFNNPVLLKTVQDKFAEKVAGYIKNSLHNCESLVRERTKLKSEIGNLMQFVKAGDTSEAIRDELRKCELRLSDIDMALGAATGKQSKLQDVSLDDITKRMQKLLGNIGSKSDSTISINHTLKRIIPDPLLVHCSEISDEVMLNIKGELRPFSLQLPTFPTSGSGTGNRTPV